MIADYGLLNKLGDEQLNLDPRNNWRVHHLLEECWHKADGKGQNKLREATPWFFNERDAGGQLSLALYGDELLP